VWDQSSPGTLAVGRKGKAHDRQTCVYHDRHIPEIARIAEAVHSTGSECKVIAQLSYAGRQVFHDNNTADCVGPLDVPSPVLRKRARVLSVSDIRQIIDCFSAAIGRVKKAVF
jgi:2,4-dienoyl-CoA reductase-like NADH-dependent reductase (Old Yellow Enzyme family)